MADKIQDAFTESPIRTSAKALVIRDGQMLAVRLRDEDGELFIMPGGGQMAGELLPMAVEREVAEETGISVRAKDVAFIIEGAQGERHHRVDIVFSCEYCGKRPTRPITATATRQALRGLTSPR